jgi:hypothetical protein
LFNWSSRFETKASALQAAGPEISIEHVNFDARTLGEPATFLNGTGKSRLCQQAQRAPAYANRCVR